MVVNPLYVSRFDTERGVVAWVPPWVSVKFFFHTFWMLSIPKLIEAFYFQMK